MSARKKNKLSPLWLALIVSLVLFDLGLFIRRQMIGNNVALLNPKGFIANEQHKLMVYTVGIMLLIAIPALILVYFTAWKYRESNTKAKYEPSKKHGRWFNFGIWALPASFMVALAILMIPATHRLAPQKQIVSDVEPLTIQVVSLRWKWLFLYPEQNIATVNFVQLPIDTPIQFELTADETPMSSFWVPNLGGQLYTMTGHVNRLNLMADTVGDFPGRSAEINGAGFAGMLFNARVGSAVDFDVWVKQVKESSNVLDEEEYQKILKPSENNAVAYYSAYYPDLYDKVVTKYTGQLGAHKHAE